MRSMVCGVKGIRIPAPCSSNVYVRDNATELFRILIYGKYWIYNTITVHVKAN